MVEVNEKPPVLPHPGERRDEPLGSPGDEVERQDLATHPLLLAKRDQVGAVLPVLEDCVGNGTRRPAAGLVPVQLLPAAVDRPNVQPGGGRS